MRDRNGKRPQPQLSWPYARQSPRVASHEKSVDAEADHQQAGTDLDLALPEDEADQQRAK
ncbi:MAG TPA: hypothetical protein VFG62_15895 [Rhodopila sp.]|jgi:hypothetical protein|nr:hypothetical protein [Rhodopila sp.]